MTERKRKGIEQRKRMLDAIIAYIQEHGYPPTVEEIGQAVGLKSKATTHHHLNVLFEEGKLETNAPGAPRAIRVPGYRFEKEDDKNGIK